MGEAIRALQRGWWVPVVYGVIAILFGIMAFLWPIGTALALAWTFGVMALAEGITSLVALFMKSMAASGGWLAVYALCSIAFGAVAVMYPGIVASVLLTFLAAWLIVAGVYRIVFAIQVRKYIDGEWMIGLCGVLAIALGLLIFVYPTSGLISVAVWIGAVALVYGVFQIIVGLKLRRLPDRLRGLI